MEYTYLRIILIFFILTLSSCGGGDAPPNPTTDTVFPNPTTSTSSSEVVDCASDSNKKCIEITLECINAGWFDKTCGPDSETIQIPHGRDIYALLVSGYYQNKNFDMFHWYNFARCLQEKNAYVHYAWWNNLLAPYMKKALHSPISTPGINPIPHHDNGGGNWYWPVNFRPNKAIPAEDHQFQADAKAMIQAIRRHNSTTAIILVGHSMGGDAVTRLATDPELKDDGGKMIDISLLAPIDPVGNRTCLPTATNNSLVYCSGNDHFWRYQTAREDFSRAFENIFNIVPKRQFGTNIKYLYHRWQHEFDPPYDSWLYQGDLFIHNILFNYPNHEWEKNIDNNATNIQWPVATSRRSGEDVPASYGGPDYLGGGNDGHGEIVGFRGVKPLTTESWPLALDAPDWFWPVLGCDTDSKTKADCRVFHLKNWENNPNYLDNFNVTDTLTVRMAPLEPPDDYCKDQESKMAVGGDAKDYCTYCMVSGDLCTILKKKLKFSPVADAGPDQTVECSASIGTEVRLDGSGSRDPNPDDSLNYTWIWPLGTATGERPFAYFPLGTQTVTLTVSDGNLTDTDTVDINVHDTTPPTLSVALSPNVLWPPNHKLVKVTASIQINDSCDDSPTIKLVSIISNEADNGMGDGDTGNDIQGAEFGTDDREFLLRAERSGKGLGRIYTVTYSATDSSGNVNYATAEVTVPHDHGKSK